MRHPRGVPRYPFWVSAVCRDPPDVQFVGKRTLNKVNKCLVRRPQRKVTVQSRGRCEDGPSLRLPAAIRYKQGIPRSRRVVSKPRAVVRPVELRYALKVWSRLAPQRRYRPDADVAAARTALLATPKCNQRTVRRKPHRADRWIDEFLRGAAGQVMKFSRTRL